MTDLAVFRSAPTEALREILERGLASHFARPVCIVRFARRPSPYRTSFALEEISVTLEDGTECEVMFKDLSRESLSAAARAVKPTFVHDPRREIDAYGRILGDCDCGTATCFAAVADGDHHWLLLEKVPGVELYQVGELAVWQTVATWLGTVHARFSADAPMIASEVKSLLRYDPAFYRVWLHRALEFTAERSPSEVPGLQRLAGRYDEVVDRLIGLPRTFIHGELYASNVLVMCDRQPPRVCPVDWEMCGVGPGLLDVAALTTGGWTDDQRRSIALAYFAALPPGTYSSESEFLAALDYCDLHLAVQWSGWAREWSPPAGHAQNWLGRALATAARLRLMD
jgi:hypothetical protein